MRFLWKGIDNPSRLSSALAIFAGSWSVFLILFAISHGVGYQPAGSPLQIFAILGVLILIFMVPMSVLGGGLILLTVEMSQSQRGILGFIVFLTAVVLLFFCVIITMPLLVHTSL